MKKNLLLLAPIAMLALAACNKSETPATPEGDDATKTAETTPPAKLPPPITASATYRCADNTILYVDFLGKNEAADIRVGDKTATAVRVEAAAPAVPEAATPAGAPATPAPEAASAGPLKSADGKTTLAGSGKQINVKLGDKGAQTCKA